jgi:hypothetical protein
VDRIERKKDFYKIPSNVCKPATLAGSLSLMPVGLGVINYTTPTT